jgi:single-stranded-DNA-specific exonuclease
MSEAALLPAGPPRRDPVGGGSASLRVVAAEPAPGQPTLRLATPTYDFAAARTLERELGVSHVLAQILVRRGLGDAAAASAFLDPRVEHDPLAFAGIEGALELIGRHVRAGTRITVHGDYDVDGVCATALLVRALRALGANAGWFLPSRVDDGYGLSLATIERLAAQRTGLLVTVDCGITAVEEVAFARRAGLDVVISDHHAPRADGRLPDAPIVHPAVCGYPCADLCGTGVAFKLAQALGASSAADDLELVALATVADLVPLRGENRRLVRHGLSALANTPKPGLRALMAVARTDPSDVSAHTLGFRLGPRINASGRLRRADAGVELLLTDDPDRAMEIAQELDRANLERRALEQRIVWEAEAQIASLGARSAYVLAAEGWHPGVIGIVASRVVERHHRPAILIALAGDQPAPGSGRSIPGFDLLAALHGASAQMATYGGHRAAAGLTVEPARIDALRAAIERHASEVLTPELLQPVERVDAVVSGSDLGLGLAEELAMLEPCGMGNPSPRLLIPGGRFAEPRPMGEGRHARFTVRSGGSLARAVAFGCGGRLPGAPGEPLDATFRLERSTWGGVVEPRLVLRHAEPCASAPIELLGEKDYLAVALAELDGPLAGARPDDASASADPVPQRELLDRRGESPLAVLRDGLASGHPLLGLCADVARRVGGLGQRVGGFALSSYGALERDPTLSERFVHVVALDPPGTARADVLAQRGEGFIHLAWGDPELRFAEQMHELEYGLRSPLGALYRSLRDRGRVTGEELEQLLRGDGPHGRPARLAGRLMRVLAELELVSLDRDLPALAVASSAPTALERSPAYRAYATRYEDGQRFLSSVRARRSG